MSFIHHLSLKKETIVRRIFFAYSRKEGSGENGCLICANSIIGKHFGDTRRRHRVVINSKSMIVYEEEGIYKKVLETCPVRLRQLEGSSEQFYYVKEFQFIFKLKNNKHYSLLLRLLKPEQKNSERNACPLTIRFVLNTKIFLVKHINKTKFLGYRVLIVGQ